MAYSLWLSYNNQQEGFQLPINPGSIEMGDGGNGQTYDVVGLGEINVIKSPKLTEYSFGGILPADKYHFVSAEKLLDPKDYIDYITRWMATKRPIRFVFTGDSFDINVAASIEAFDWKEVAGSGGDVEYTLKLKKYLFYAPQKVSIITKSDSTTTIAKADVPRESDRETPATYTMVAGDSLWAVAQKVMGNGARWTELQKLNNIPDARLKSLAVGTVLKLPVKGR